MGLDQIVNVVVTTANPGLTAQGFGIPLILGPAAFVEFTRTYNSIGAVGGDFAVTDPVYMAANAIFGQKTAPPTIMVGREATVPTQRFSVGVQNVVAGTNYQLRLAAPSGGAWVSQTASFSAVAAAWLPTHAYVPGNLVTNDTGKLYTCTVGGTSAGSGGPTGSAGTPITDGSVTWLYAGAGGVGATSNDAIVNGLSAAIAALNAPTLAVTLSLQGSAGSKTLRILANVAGAYFGLEVLNRAALNAAQDHADPGVATDLANVLLESSAWYGLITLFNSAALGAAAAAWVQSNKKLYVFDSLDTAIATHALSGATDVFATLKSSSYSRTHGFYHPANDEFAAAAEVGYFFPINPGGDNWRLKTLQGPKVKKYSDTEQTNITAKFGNFYAALGSSSGGSTNVIQGNGQVFSGEYVDVIRFIDWYVANLQTDLINALIQNNKIAYTDLGVSVLENIVRARNKAGIAAGGIAADPAPTVIAEPVADQSTSDKQNRVYNGLSTSWEEAGAINSLTVNVAIAA